MRHIENKFGSIDKFLDDLDLKARYKMQLNQRRGQAYSNAASELLAGTYYIRWLNNIDPSIDPFHDDSKLPTFLDALIDELTRG